MKVATVLLILISIGSGYSQGRLVLLKENKIITRFLEGDRIRFKRKDRDFYSNGIITGIRHNYFKLGDEDTTYLHQIQSIDMHGHSNSGFKTADTGIKLMMAGVLLLLVDLLNPSNGSQVDDGLIVVSSALFGSGAVMVFVNNSYFKIGRKKKVMIID